jgi:putative ATPase
MGQMGLFEDSSGQSPLAYRMRPETLDEYMGQPSLIQRIKSLNFNNLPHLIFWGPPGCGKTTIAHILAKQAGLELYPFNAVLGGVADLRKIIQSAIEMGQLQGKRSIIFIDEIHRFNKAQQDALLPYLEKGDFVLFGATTEYPQTSLNRAIISRVQVIGLGQLQDEDIFQILSNAAINEDLLLSEDILRFLASFSNGDARTALNNLEILADNRDKIQGKELDDIKTEILNLTRTYDKDSDRHYDVISAFIKSVRGSDVNAAITWLAVMIDGGEDIEFIARRLIILASEDVGNADPRALQVATSAHYAIKNIGMPEARIILAQATSYLARAPKSNASYLAIDAALDYVRNNPTIEVPTHLRNKHPDKKNYKYAHAYPGHWVEQDYIPANIPTDFFESTELGYEKQQSEYMNQLKKR